MEYSSTALLLLALIALSAGAPVLAQQTGAAELEGYVGEQNYTVTYTIAGYSPSLENITLDFYGEATGNAITGYIDGVMKTQNKTMVVDAVVEYRTTVTVDGYSLQSLSDVDASLNLIVDLTQMQANQTTPFPVDKLNLSIAVTSSSNTTGDVNETYTSTSATVKLSLVDGMQIIGFGQGDIVMDLYLDQDSYSNMANRTQHLEGTFIIDFNSGNPFVDNQLAAFLYQMLAQVNLSQAISNTLETANATIINLEVSLTLDAANAAIKIEYDIRYQGPETLTIPGFSKANMQHDIGSMPFTNMTMQTPLAVPVEPLNFSMSTYMEVSTIDSGLGYDYKFTGNLTVESSKNMLAYTGIDHVGVDGHVDNGSYSIIITVAGSDPYTAAPLIKGLIDASIGAGTPVNVTITTGPNVTVYEVTSNGLEPLTSKTYTSQGPLAIVVEVGGTLVEASNDTIRISGTGPVSVPAMAFMAYDSLESNTSVVKANIPEPMMLAAAYNISFSSVSVELDKGSILHPGAEIRVLTIDEANASLTGLGYAAAGPGIAVNGVDGSGIVVIDLDTIPDGLVVVRVLHNGTIQELDYTVVDGKIIAATPGFSMIIPAVEVASSQEPDTGGQQDNDTTVNETAPDSGQQDQNQTETETGDTESQDDTITNETDTTMSTNETSTETGDQNTTETTPPSEPATGTGTPQETETSNEETKQEVTTPQTGPATGGSESGDQATTEPETIGQAKETQPVENATTTSGTQVGGNNTLVMAAVALLIIAIVAVVLLRR